MTYSEIENRRRALEEAGIHKRYQHVTFDRIAAKGLPDVPDIRANYEAAKEYAAGLKDNIARGYGLILAGSVGTLKTTLAVAILRAQLDRGERGFMVPMCSMIDRLFTLRDGTDRTEYVNFENQLRNTPLLVLDDLGAEITGQNWVRSKTDSIISDRYARMLPMIITTNLSVGELANTYAGRIIDRLRSTSRVLIFTGKSQREAIA